MTLDDYIDDNLEGLVSDDDLIQDDDPNDHDTPPITPEPPQTDDDNDDNEPPALDDDAVAYFEYLKVNNILDVPEDFEFDGTANSIEEALEITRQSMSHKIFHNLWNALPNDFKPLLQYGLSGGESLEKYLSAHKPLSYSEADLDDPIIQERVIRDYYKELNPKSSPEKIDKLIDRLKSLDDADLKSEAQDAIEYLKDLRQQEQQSLLKDLEDKQKADKEKMEAETALLSQLIDSTKHFDTLRKNRIKGFILNPIKNGNQVTTEFAQTLDALLDKPEHLVQLADIIADYDPRIGFNFDRLKRQLKTESVKNFKDTIRSKIDTKQKIKGDSQRQLREDFDWDKFLSS